MKIGLLGGTFDPIHQGHMLLGQLAREQFDLDEIWYLPAGQPYFKEGKGISTRPDRLAMTSRAVGHLPWARVCDVEIRREGCTYTYETIEELKAAHPAHQFSFIFGADCLDQLENWKEPARILAGAGIIAAGRGRAADYQAMEEKAAALTERFGGRIEILRMEARACVILNEATERREGEDSYRASSAGSFDSPCSLRMTDLPISVLDLSSTQVRERVKAGESITGMVPEGVEAFIKRQGLYRGGSQWPSPGPSIKAILFDMDGTLLDTERLFIDEWVKADGRESPELMEALYAIIGVTREQAEAIIYQKLGTDYPYEHCRAYVDEAFRRAREEGTLPLKAGAREILESLWQQGYKLALASSTMREMVVAEMQAVGLYDFFDAIITGDDAPRGKPAPDIFLNAAKALDTDPAACLVIEDSYNGIRAAHAAGMRAVMVPDIKPPTAEMESLAERICRDLEEARQYISAC